MNDWSFKDSLISINLRKVCDSFFKNQGKGGGEVINLEKQFVKGLQNLGEPSSILKVVGKLQNLQYEIGRMADIFLAIQVDIMKYI